MKSARGPGRKVHAAFFFAFFVANAFSCDIQAADDLVDERQRRIVSRMELPAAREGVEGKKNSTLIAEGKRAFFDPLHSKSGRVSCATCHQPARAFTDGRRLAKGEGEGVRNTPTVLGIPADSIRERALTALMSPQEHGLDESRQEEAARVARQVAAYVATQDFARTRFDAFVSERNRTGHSDLLNASERRGLALFLGKAGCVRCHFGSRFSSGAFHNIGTALIASPAAQESLVGAIKVPTLRELSRIAPYFHDGRHGTLEEVVEHYVRAPAAIVGTDSTAADAQRAFLYCFFFSHVVERGVNG